MQFGLKNLEGIGGDAGDALAELKQQPRPDLTVIGGGKLM